METMIRTDDGILLIAPARANENLVRDLIDSGTTRVFISINAIKPLALSTVKDYSLDMNRNMLLGKIIRFSPGHYWLDYQNGFHCNLCEIFGGLWAFSTCTNEPRGEDLVLDTC